METKIERCALCGESFDRDTMHYLFTGRAKYICRSCYRRGQAQVNGRRKDWRRSARGKAVIEQCRKNK